MKQSRSKFLLGILFGIGLAIMLYTSRLGPPKTVTPQPPTSVAATTTPTQSVLVIGNTEGMYFTVSKGNGSWCFKSLGRAQLYQNKTVVVPAGDQKDIPEKGETYEVNPPTEFLFGPGKCE